MGQAPTQIFFSVFLLYMEKKKLWPIQFFGDFFSEEQHGAHEGQHSAHQGQHGAHEGQHVAHEGQNAAVPC